MFISDQSAKGVLRSVVKEATSKTMTTTEIYLKLVELTKLNVVAPKLALKCNAVVSKCAIVQLTAVQTNKVMIWIGVVPYFIENDRGWELRLTSFMVHRTRSSIEVREANGNIVFIGHALERLFQRSSAIGWEVVKKEIVSMFQYGSIYNHTSLFKQVVFPCNSGCFIGNADVAPNGKDRYVIKTFIRRSDKYGRVIDSLKALSEEINLGKFNILDLTESQREIAHDRMRELLKREPWMGTEYVEKVAETV